MTGFTVMPSLDVEAGVAVKRVRGVRGSGLVLGDPVALAARYEEEGARWLHVVDLDGAERGYPANLHVVRAVREATGLRVQFGGGVRSVEAAERALEAGADRVVVGTAWVEDPGLLARIVDELGADTVVAAVDEARSGRVAYRGWSAEAPLTVEEGLRVVEAAGARVALYTQTWLDGSASGPDRARALRVRRATRLDLIFAGGVASAADVAWLCRAGFQGAVLGMALHAGLVRLGEVLRVAEEGGCGAEDG